MKCLIATDHSYECYCGAVVAMGSCFGLVSCHKYGIAVGHPETRKQFLGSNYRRIFHGRSNTPRQLYVTKTLGVYSKTENLKSSVGIAFMNGLTALAILLLKTFKSVGKPKPK